MECNRDWRGKNRARHEILSDLVLKEKTYKSICAIVDRVLRRLGALKQDIEDITHEVFCEIISQKKLFAEGKEDQLRRVVIWRAVRRYIDIRRKDKWYAEIAEFELEGDEGDEGWSVEEVLAIKSQQRLMHNGDPYEQGKDNPEQKVEIAELLEDSLSVLNESEKRVIDLHIVKGFTIKEIAMILRESDDKRAQSWVSQQKRRAIRKLSIRYKYLDNC
jgi:RNA polymerase sigma factor (sigma-70 family)